MLPSATVRRRVGLWAWLCLPLMLCAAADWPLVDTSEAMRAHDGQLVRLKGTYRALKKSRSMRHDPVDFGHAAIVIGERPVQLGTLPRPPEERERLLGRTVVARGKLLMRPPMAYPPHMAQPLPPPTLFLYGVPQAMGSDAEPALGSTAD
jgi:hypothetical protein